MKNDDKIWDEKMLHDINREAAKISAWPSSKIEKYEYLRDEEIILPDQRRIIEQAKFTYFPSAKYFEKQVKIIQNQGEKQIKALEGHGKQLVKSNAFAEKNSLPLDE